MFKNRELKVTMDKKDKRKHIPEDEDPSYEEQTFEEKADIVQRYLEDAGKKIFAGICIYVVLDTWRKISVERARKPKID